MPLAARGWSVCLRPWLACRRYRHAARWFAVHLLSAGAEDRHQARVGTEGVEAGPGFSRSTSPRGVDEADGHVFLLLERASEEVGHRRKVLCSIWRAQRPAGSGFNVLQWIVGGVFFNKEEPDLWIAGGGDLLCRRL